MAAERVSVPVPFLVSPSPELPEIVQPTFIAASLPTSIVRVAPFSFIWPTPVEALVKLAVVEAFTARSLDKTRPCEALFEALL